MVGKGLTVLSDMGYLLHDNHLMFSVGEVLLSRPYNVQRTISNELCLCTDCDYAHNYVLHDNHLMFQWSGEGTSSCT